MTSQKYTGIFADSFENSNSYRNPFRKKKGPSNPDRKKKKKLPPQASTLHIGVVNYDK